MGFNVVGNFNQRNFSLKYGALTERYGGAPGGQRPHQIYIYDSIGGHLERS